MTYEEDVRNYGPNLVAMVNECRTCDGSGLILVLENPNEVIACPDCLGSGQQSPRSRHNTLGGFDNIQCEEFLERYF